MDVNSGLIQLALLSRAVVTTAVLLNCSSPLSAQLQEHAVVVTAECSPVQAAFGAGTDRLGNRWLWNRDQGRVEMLDDGKELQVVELPPARAVDFDAAWGIVLLDVHGRVLKLVRSPTTVASWPLPDEATDLVWIGSDQVALATARAANALEIFDVRSGTTIRRFVADGEIRPSVGATLLRSLMLAVDHRNQRLHTLDSLTGRFRVFDFEGELVREEQAEAHRLPAIERWAEAVSHEAKLRNEVQTPLYSVLRTAVDGEGAGWVVEECNEQRTQATLVRFPASGGPERFRVAVDRGCCSLNFAFWRDELVFLPPSSAAACHCTSPRRSHERQSK